MFFFFSQIFNLIFDIYNLIIFLLIIGILIDFYKKRTNYFFVSILLIIILTSIFPTGKLMMMYLERDYHEISLPNQIDGVIILSGAIEPNLSKEFNSIQLNSAGERIVKFTEFLNNSKIKKIYSGGNAKLFDQSLNQSYFAEKFFSKYNPVNLFYENKSKNTYENIKFTKELANPKTEENWIIITSAYHMKRSLNVANNLKWKLHPLPVDFQTEKNFIWYKNIKPFSNLLLFKKASREILANFIYNKFIL